MIAIDPFRASDLAAIRLQPEQIMFDPQPIDEAERAAWLESAGPAFTARQGDRVLICAGLIENRADYASGWAMIAADNGMAMRAITRAVQAVIDAAPYRRIDIAVRDGFAAGCKWAERLLGFRLEGQMRRWGADGSDYRLYARVRD